MDTTTEALDALSEALGPEWRDWLAWLPCGLLAVGTEVWTLRTGHTPATSLYRFMWSKPPLRFGLIVWAAITAAHLHRWPAAWTKFDPYSAIGGHIARQQLERSRTM